MRRRERKEPEEVSLLRAIKVLMTIGVHDVSGTGIPGLSKRDQIGSNTILEGLGAVVDEVDLDIEFLAGLHLVGREIVLQSLDLDGRQVVDVLNVNTVLTKVEALSGQVAIDLAGGIVIS